MREVEAEVRVVSWEKDVIHQACDVLSGESACVLQASFRT